MRRGARRQLAGVRHLGIPAGRAARLGGQNIFFYGDLDDIALDDPTRERWFNIDAGFERDPARVPAAFQKRAFPFRIDGVRGMPLTFTNLSIQRNFGAGGRSHVAAPDRRAEHLQPPAVDGPDPESDQHAVRPGHDRRAEPDALLHLRHPRDVLGQGSIGVRILEPSGLCAPARRALCR